MYSLAVVNVPIIWNVNYAMMIRKSEKDFLGSHRSLEYKSNDENRSPWYNLSYLLNIYFLLSFYLLRGRNK